MRESVDEWLTVVDARGRSTAAIGLALGFVVSLIEIAGAGMVAITIRLATAAPSSTVTAPILGDVESVLPGATRSADLRWMAVVGSLFFVLRGLAVIFQQYFTFRSSFGLAVRLTDRVIERFLDRDYGWHLSQNSSELSSVSIGVCQFFASKIFTPLQLAGSQALTVLSLAFVAIAVEPVGALVAVVAIGTVIGVLLSSSQRWLVPLSRIEVDELAVGQQLTTEAFQAIREVKVLSLSASIRGRIRVSRRRWAKAMRQSVTIVSAPRTVIETVAFIALISLVSFRGQSGGAAGLAGVGVLGYAVIRILPTANNMVTHINTVRSGRASMHRLAEVLRPTANGFSGDGARSPGAPSNLPLEAVGVKFSYPTGEKVLAGVDLRVERGASIGLVGTTGSGKSTLLDVLAGLLPPTSGRVLLDGVPVEDCLDSWWKEIGIVPQTITLLDAPLSENIALGVAAERIDRHALSRAIRLAQLEDVVDGLPDGVETPIGERGVRLSGGQRQRVAIARALYRDPPVILLDEGTSALDAQTERAVVAGLKAERLDRTLVMVAHRISTLRDCDEILLLEGGRVTSRGSYDDLLNASSVFRGLAASDTGTAGLAPNDARRDGS